MTESIHASPPRAWAEIDLGALRHNLAVARRAAGCAIMGVVKAGAYGHGLEKIAAVLAGEGVEFLGVANVGEARRIAEGLVVDEARMRANLDLTGGLLFTDAVVHRLAEHIGREATHGLLDKAADEVRQSGRHLRLVLAEGPIPANLKAEVEAAFDLGPSIDAAAAATDRILAATKTARPRERRR